MGQFVSICGREGCAVNSMSHSFSSAIDFRGRWERAMRLLASFCFLDFASGSVSGGLELWCGDHRTGRDEFVPGVMGNSKWFSEVTVWGNVG